MIKKILKATISAMKVYLLVFLLFYIVGVFYFSLLGFTNGFDYTNSMEKSETVLDILAWCMVIIGGVAAVTRFILKITGSSK